MTPSFISLEKNLSLILSKSFGFSARGKLHLFIHSFNYSFIFRVLQSGLSSLIWRRAPGQAAAAAAWKQINSENVITLIISNSWNTKRKEKTPNNLFYSWCSVYDQRCQIVWVKSPEVIITLQLWITPSFCHFQENLQSSLRNPSTKIKKGRHRGSLLFMNSSKKSAQSCVFPDPER